MRSSGRSILYIALALVVCLSATGCGSGRWFRLRKSKAAAEFQIIPQNNRYRLSVPLTADDIVNMMLKIGFSDQQIVELGEALRDALMSSGAAQIKRGKIVEAILGVYEDDCIYISARQGGIGISIYDVRQGRFRLGQNTETPAP